MSKRNHYIHFYNYENTDKDRSDAAYATPLHIKLYFLYRGIFYAVYTT